MEDTLAKLGKSGRDIVTDFNGTITAVCFYWGGSIRLGITPKTPQDKNLLKEEWFDEARIEIEQSLSEPM